MSIEKKTETYSKEEIFQEAEETHVFTSIFRLLIKLRLHIQNIRVIGNGCQQFVVLCYKLDNRLVYWMYNICMHDIFIHSEETYILF